MFNFLKRKRKNLWLPMPNSAKRSIIKKFLKHNGRSSIFDIIKFIKNNYNFEYSVGGISSFLSRMSGDGLIKSTGKNTYQYGRHKSPFIQEGEYIMR